MTVNVLILIPLVITIKMQFIETVDSHKLRVFFSGTVSIQPQETALKYKIPEVQAAQTITFSSEEIALDGQ